MIKALIASVLCFTLVACKTTRSDQRNSDREAEPDAMIGFQNFPPIVNLELLRSTPLQENFQNDLEETLSYNFYYDLAVTKAERKASEAANADPAETDNDSGCTEPEMPLIKVLRRDQIAYKRSNIISKCKDKFTFDDKTFESTLDTSLNDTLVIQCLGVDLRSIVLNAKNEDALLSDLQDACKGKTIRISSSEITDTISRVEGLDQDSSQNFYHFLLSGDEGSCTKNPEGKFYRVKNCVFAEMFSTKKVGDPGQPKANNVEFIHYIELLEDEDGDLLEGELEYKIFYGWSGKVIVRPNSRIIEYDFERNGEKKAGTLEVKSPPMSLSLAESINRPRQHQSTRRTKIRIPFLKR